MSAQVIIAVIYTVGAIGMFGLGVMSIGIARYWHEASQEREFAFIGGRNTSHRNRVIVLVCVCFALAAIAATMAVYYYTL